VNKFDCFTALSLSRGDRVLAVDADTQQTAVAWSRAAPERPFPAAAIGMASFADKLHREVQRHPDNCDYIVIDLPASVEAATPAAALLMPGNFEPRMSDSRDFIAWRCQGEDGKMMINSARKRTLTTSGAMSASERWTCASRAIVVQCKKHA